MNGRNEFDRRGRAGDFARSGEAIAAAATSRAWQLVLPALARFVLIILVIFMLLDRENIRNRVLRLIGEEHLMATTKALDDAGHRISRYLLAQLFLNCLFIPFGIVHLSKSDFIAFRPDDSSRRTICINDNLPLPEIAEKWRMVPLIAKWMG